MAKGGQFSRILQYILLGMYFEQLYFLGPKWLTDKLLPWQDLDKSFWLPFLGGMAYGKPPGSKETFLLLFPYYQRTIREQQGLFTRYHHGIIRHIVAFLLWDFESIKDDRSLNSQLLEECSVHIVQDYATFLWQQQRYLDKNDLHDLETLREKVSEIWQRLISRLKVSTAKEDMVLIASLFHFSEYYDLLNNAIVQLLIPSARLVQKYHEVNGLLKEMQRFAEVTTVTSQAVFIAEVLKEITYKNSFDFDKKLLIKLVVYLFENGEYEVARFICNKIQIDGMDFLKDTYYKYSGWLS